MQFRQSVAPTLFGMCGISDRYQIRQVANYLCNTSTPGMPQLSTPMSSAIIESPSVSMRPVKPYGKGGNTSPCLRCRNRIVHLDYNLRYARDRMAHAFPPVQLCVYEEHRPSDCVDASDGAFMPELVQVHDVRVLRIALDAQLPRITRGGDGLRYGEVMRANSM